jgi:hypothetical protein
MAAEDLNNEATRSLSAILFRRQNKVLRQLKREQKENMNAPDKKSTSMRTKHPQIEAPLAC